MKKIRYLVLPVYASIIFILPASAGDGNNNSFTIESYFGTVAIQDSYGKKEPRVGYVFSKGDTITTGKKSVIHIVNNDKGIIRINEKSSVSILSLISAAEKDTEILIKAGSVNVTLSKLNKNSRFRVKTSTTVASVRGTTFAVSVDDDSSQTDVLAGTVTVNPVDDGKVMEDIVQEVGENQQAVIRRDEIREIIRNRRMKIREIRKERRERLRKEFGAIDTELVDSMGPELRKEIRMRVMMMRKSRFASMEKGREKRLKAWRKKRQQRIDNFRKRLLKKVRDPEKRKKLKRLMEKKDEFREKRRKRLKEIRKRRRGGND